MNSDNESDTEDESKSDTEDLFNENQHLLKKINDIKSTFDSLQLRKKFREKIEDMENYEQDEWKKILN